MIAVIFEVRPIEGRKGQYLDIASQLRPMLEEIDGFISVERFQSLTDPSKILSLSFFRDEEAVKAWRQLPAHQAAQKQGQQSIFQDYRLRVTHVIRDYGLNNRAEAPENTPVGE